MKSLLCQRRIWPKRVAEEESVVVLKVIITNGVMMATRSSSSSSILNKWFKIQLRTYITTVLRSHSRHLFFPLPFPLPLAINIIHSFPSSLLLLVLLLNKQNKNYKSKTEEKKVSQYRKGEGEYIKTYLIFKSHIYKYII